MTGSTLAHAAAFDTPSGAIMLTGPGGSGKSTTTAAAIVHGWKIIGEDLCWVEFDEDRVFAHRLYNTLKITDEARSEFRFIDDLVESHDHEQFEKTVVYLDETLLARQADRRLRPHADMQIDSDNRLTAFIVTYAGAQQSAGRIEHIAVLPDAKICSTRAKRKLAYRRRLRGIGIFQRHESIMDER